MYTIVVADDEEELRRAIIRKIDWESIGFQVVGEAENGIEALELVERMEPDLLLTDIRMPFVSGIELARQVREVRPTTQIAFLSGFDEFSYAQQAIQYNIISYMLKPITMVDLTEELKKIKLKIDGIFAEFDARKHDNPDLQQFFLPLLLDDYASFEGQDREELLQEQAVGNGFLKDRNNAFQYAVLAITVEDTNGKNRTRPELVHSVDMILQKYMKHYSFAMDGRIISAGGHHVDLRPVSAYCRGRDGTEYGTHSENALSYRCQPYQRTSGRMPRGLQRSYECIGILHSGRERHPLYCR